MRKTERKRSETRDEGQILPVIKESINLCYYKQYGMGKEITRKIN